jgi:hypothetical protein
MSDGMGAITDTAAAGAWVAAALLLLAGSAKLRRPRGTVTAVVGAGLPASPALVRGLGGLEVVVAIAALALGGPAPAAAMAALYAAFAVYVVGRRRRDRAAVCGCFGDDRSALTSSHVVLTSAAAGVCTVAAVTAAPGVGRLTQIPMTTAGATLAAAVATAWLARLLLTAAPDLRAAIERHPPRPHA